MNQTGPSPAEAGLGNGHAIPEKLVPPSVFYSKRAEPIYFVGTTSDQTEGT
ncbi:hypothetical protein IscW_ISCW011103 [Ixodes scapularis]|uniref:Uncharacterized protein n=1 Tax=Ixodes scapularis TaxID=6945 RepID=B7Q600_IXOSC|nr:hypothetical protein IscW_ISCW011103 [Ixodes scapularis]|eukprot:XP_002411849.1 hypothetical protein IscW_ISCW011103 [Ixodes scapularis]